MEFSDHLRNRRHHSTRDFFYPKPRLLLAWPPDSHSQLRLRAERVVGQLNFTDFVASVNLSGFGVAARQCRPAARPALAVRGDAGTAFLGQGRAGPECLHEDITDLEDYIPVGGGLDAPGNIPHTVSDKFSLSGTIAAGLPGPEERPVEAHSLLERQQPDRSGDRLRRRISASATAA